MDRTLIDGLYRFNLDVNFALHEGQLEKINSFGQRRSAETKSVIWNILLQF